MNAWMALMVGGLLFLPSFAEGGTEEKSKGEGLVAYYGFDEGSGTVATDKSGNKNDGKINGTAEWVTVGNGYALKFDGQTTYVDCGAGKSLNIDSAGTVECWFNAEELQGGLVTRSTSAEWKDERLVLTIRSDQKYLLWSLADGTVSQSKQFPETKTFTWTHVALTFDGTNIVWYKDGQHAGAVAQELKPAIKDVPLIIGRSDGFGEACFRGMIDEVRIYNRALTQEEILEHYKLTVEYFKPLNK